MAFSPKHLPLQVSGKYKLFCKNAKVLKILFRKKKSLRDKNSTHKIGFEGILVNWISQRKAGLLRAFNTLM